MMNNQIANDPNGSKIIFSPSHFLNYSNFETKLFNNSLINEPSPTLMAAKLVYLCFAVTIGPVTEETDQTNKKTTVRLRTTDQPVADVIYRSRFFRMAGKLQIMHCK